MGRAKTIFCGGSTMSDKVAQYIEVYKTWKSGPASPKTYNQLVTLRESMTPEEQELLARTLTPKTH